MSARADVAGLDLVRVYVWQWPVRIAHWATFLAVIVLAFTGLYLGHPFLVAPGAAGEHFVTGTMRAIHGYAAIVFTLAVISRLAWMFLGNRWARWDRFIPAEHDRQRGLWATFKFYTFVQRRVPTVVGHNPLAGLAYLAVYGLMLVQILTGLGIYAWTAHVDSPFRAFAFLVPLLGGLQSMRWVHHVIMWLLLGFSVHHVYSGWLMSWSEGTGTMESIFSGYKFLPRSLLQAFGVDVDDEGRE